MSFVGFTTMRADWLINRIRHKTIFTKNQTLHSQHFLFHMIVVIINFLIAAFLPLFFFPTHLLHLSNLRIRSSNSSIFFVRLLQTLNLWGGLIDLTLLLINISSIRPPHRFSVFNSLTMLFIPRIHRNEINGANNRKYSEILKVRNVKHHTPNNRQRL